MKKWIFPFLILLCFTRAEAEEPSVSAKSAIVFEYATGKIVFSKNPYEELPMASTTKIMTALVALERGNLTDLVTISPHAANVEGSSMYLRAGEKISLEDLLYGLMLSSGNDAAVAIAEHIGGSEEEFSKLMTDRAKELGCTHTQFKNPNGLPNDAHYTTAFELARITGKALEHPKFREIAGTKSKQIGNRQLTNHNKLLSMYEGTFGVKTGFTKASGRTLVSAVNRNGIELIGVTLHAPDDWDDHMKMFDYAFANMERRILAEKNAIVKTVSVENGEDAMAEVYMGGDFALSVLKTEKTSFSVNLPAKLSAPLPAESEVGVVTFYLEDVKMGEVPLVIHEEIPEKSKPFFFRYLFFVFQKWNDFYKMF